MIKNKISTRRGRTKVKAYVPAPLEQTKEN